MNRVRRERTTVTADCGCGDEQLRVSLNSGMNVVAHVDDRSLNGLGAVVMTPEEAIRFGAHLMGLGQKAMRAQRC